VTLENHVTEGGIGSLVAETIADAGIAKRLVRLGLKDTYAHGGSRPYLMRTYGLDAPALVAAIERLTGESYAPSRRRP
jgi:Transketolase, C-terminal subunit